MPYETAKLPEAFFPFIIILYCWPGLLFTVTESVIADEIFLFTIMPEEDLIINKSSPSFIVAMYFIDKGPAASTNRGKERFPLYPVNDAVLFPGVSFPTQFLEELQDTIDEMIRHIIIITWIDCFIIHFLF